ncbi:MAG: PfaB family protein [Anaerolineaceae bacterium]|nr:PfaB family protein [Anaerolineaceae bacterium]
MAEINNTGRFSPVQHFDKLAVVGMDVVFGEMDGLAAFEQAMATGAQHTRLAQGLVSDMAEVEPLLLDSAPRTLSKEDFLLLKVSGRALRDANLSSKKGAPRQTALFFIRGSELAAAALPQEAGGQKGSLEKICNFSGPFSNLSVEANPLATAVHQAQNLLYLGIVDTVVISSVVLAEDFETILMNSSSLNSGPLTLGFDIRVDGWTSGEGASAVVLMRYDSALARNYRIYAVLDALAWTPRNSSALKKNIFPTLLSSETISQSCQQAFQQANLDPAKIGYLEVLGSGFAPIDSAEISGICKAYRTASSDLNCAVGSVQTQVGHLYNATGLAGLIKTALSLYHRFIPVTPQWSGPKKPEMWDASPFYVPTDTRTWFLPAKKVKRCAAMNVIGLDGSCAHLILSEEASQQNRPNSFLAQSNFYLFPISGNNPQELSAGLERLNQTLHLMGDLRSAAIDCFKTYQDSSPAYVLSIVGHDLPEIQREIEYAAKEVPGVFEKKKSWQTPQGSFLTADPVGKQGSVAFVYPGAFNSYIGLGRDLFLLFPQLYERLVGLTADLGLIIQEGLLYPRSLEALNKEQSDALEAKLNNDPIAMIISGSLMAVLFTRILQDIFKVQPDAAFGYSLGEIAMLFGIGIWDQADQVSAKLSSSTLFRTRLSGPQNAVREFWGLQTESDNTARNGLWNNYFLMAPAEKVAGAVKEQPRAYMTHINTPRQVVIAGDQDSCQNVIDSLKCNALKAPFDFALHCDAMRSEHNALVNLLTWPVVEKPETRLYTAADDRPLPMESHGLADKIATMLCSCLDFPNLVQQVYGDGARVFIELGANSNCSKWIDDSLKEKPHLAASINRKGAEDYASIVRLLAKLASHRVQVDLSALYQ